MKPLGVGIKPLVVGRLVDFGHSLFKPTADPGVGIPPEEWPEAGILPDWAIREFITISNFVDYDECPPGVVSYGLTSAGYDLRVGYKFKVFTNARCAVVDPKNMKDAVFFDFDLTPRDGVAVADHVLIPPNSFALAETIETLHIPRNVVCWCIGKSTYARCGINMNFTPFEPGWWGVVTVEIINATPLPVKIYAGEGIGQAQFFLLTGSPEKSYGEKKNAKYQGQTGLTLPSVK